MFLKSITLKGFKSFADSTTLVLEPGVTVVVGPNGSGKSNVVDAIAWVLGAQAPSSVRSQKMDDVIFAGTAKRPALGRAEVAMTIDNSAGLLPIDFSEVTVSRTLFRTGESEYAINGVSCRLLDVQELLSDAGVGRQQHVIVSQGQIDAVLNARPEDRRAIIEEASGVLKHRKRKEKAERRLESTEANLLRAQDLLREVRRQLKPLERQADAARRHGTLAAELRTLRLHVSGRDIAALQARTQALANDKARGDESENALRARLSALDAAVMSDEAQLTARGDSTINDELARVENLRGRARGLVQVVAERRRSVERERGQMMDSGVVAQLEGEAAEVRQQLEEVAQQLRDAGGMYVGGSAAEELAALQTATATAQARLDDAISAHAAASSSAAASAARVEAFQATIDAQALSAKTLSEAVGSVGTLLELVDIDDDWRVAVQAALGESLSAVVMSDVAGARAAGCA
ncbi:MAG: chromosome segregation protein SMC, partial [Actinobacteria bacterium]|nr:chromosome segregation protein SMC [Actinomycetota bacterium]